MADSSQDRKHLLFKNGIYSVLSWVAPLIMGIVITPVVVRKLGNDAYGLYSVILGFIGYSFSIGIGKSVAKYVSEYRASNEKQKLSDTLSSILWISFAFGITSVVIVFLAANYLVVDVLRIVPEQQDIAIKAMYFAGLTILVTMLSQIFQFALQGLQRFDHFLLLTNANGLFLNLGSLLLVYIGYGVLELIIWNLVVVFLIGVLFFWNAKRLLPEFKLRLKIGNEIWAPVLKYAGSIVVYQSFGNILLLFERGWIVREFGTEALTYYVVPMSLGFYFHGLVSSVGLVMLPVVNEFLESRETLIRLYRTSMKIVLTMIGFFTVTCVFEGRVFLNTWMKADFSISYPILIIHACTFAVIAIAGVPWQMIESFGRARLNALATIIWLVISIPLMVVFSTSWQTAGVAFARLVGVFALLPAIYYVEKQLLGGFLRRFWIVNPMRLIAAAVAASVVQWFFMTTLSQGWLVLIISGGTGLIAYVGVLFVTNFFEDEEKAALKTFMMKFRRA